MSIIRYNDNATCRTLARFLFLALTHFVIYASASSFVPTACCNACAHRLHYCVVTVLQDETRTCSAFAGPLIDPTRVLTTILASMHDSETGGLKVRLSCIVWWSGMVWSGVVRSGLVSGFFFPIFFVCLVLCCVFFFFSAVLCVFVCFFWRSGVFCLF